MISNALRFIRLGSNPPEGVDWVRYYGKGKDRSWHLQKPPKMDIALIKVFTDNLEEICDQKLKIILERQSLLKREQKKRLKFLLKEKLTEGEKIPFPYLSAGLYSEYFFLNKWSKYWTNTWIEISKEKKNKVLKMVDNKRLWEQKVEKAKEYSLEDLYQGQLRRAGSRFTGACPFHNPTGEREKSPSFYIFDDNHYHCFSCGENGDSIDYVMKMHQLSFSEAIERMANGHI